MVWGLPHPSADMRCSLIVADELLSTVCTKCLMQAFCTQAQICAQPRVKALLPVMQALWLLLVLLSAPQVAGEGGRGVMSLLLAHIGHY